MYDDDKAGKLADYDWLAKEPRLLYRMDTRTLVANVTLRGISRKIRHQETFQENRDMYWDNRDLLPRVLVPRPLLLCEKFTVELYPRWS